MLVGWSLSRAYHPTAHRIDDSHLISISMETTAAVNIKKTQNNVIFVYLFIYFWGIGLIVRVFTRIS